ncbi:TetR/AcrR family transcriptional regulator [Agreia sp. COWG]|uniref:TetR/AcrR family transcriptional regulator n=1 Tax=Agreia sp. COWG TaxID=2773266 RepID=UPI001927A27F|nr:TetR/AcrR family transcriptional regulator [Agreia sp. COWG]CAD5995505.1 Regulatory TetR family protein [Agreia sp. COWG]
MPTPTRTSRDAIVLAGLEILEDSGPDGLSMRAVADRVGVKAPSLYKHVTDRGALLQLVAEATADAVASKLGDADDLAGVARAFRAFAVSRPEGFRLMLSGTTPTEFSARTSAPLLRVAAGLAGEAHALAAARLITAWLTGFVTMELAGAFQLGGDVDEAFEFGIDRLSTALTSS